MKVSQYCKPHVISIASSADVAEAARLMRSEHVGFLVVCNDGDELIAVDDAISLITGLLSDISGSIARGQGREKLTRAG